MRTATHLLAFTFLPLLFLAKSCVKDSEETNDEEPNLIEAAPNTKGPVTKAMVIENWETFIKQSQDAIDITETNISSLETKIEEADGAEKTEMQEVCNASNLALLKLKARRIKRNKDFSTELENFKPSDTTIEQKNEAFKSQFSRELVDLNETLEQILEKSRSGYFK